MKTLKVIALSLLSVVFISCSSDPVYVPVYVPYEKKVTKKATPPKMKPKPVESAEGFRAVERPGAYSN